MARKDQKPSKSKEEIEQKTEKGFMDEDEEVLSKEEEEELKDKLKYYGYI